MVTVAQMKNVARFTFGSANHLVQRHAAQIEVVRGTVGDGHEIFKRQTHTLSGYIEASDGADLAAQIAGLMADLAEAEADFRVFRDGQQVIEILSSAAHYGPVASIDLDEGDFSGGLLQAFTVTVTADVPITVTGGLIDHQYVDTEETDDEGVSRNVRRGEVVMAAGNSAKTWIETPANLPVQPADTDRVLTIDTNDSDTRATYTVTDSRTVYRNQVTNEVKDHQWVDTTVTREGTMILFARRGTIEVISPEEASAWINANAIPAPNTGFARTISINVDDTTLSATYEVRDEPQAGPSWPPDISDATRTVTTAYDEQSRIVVTDAGRFVGIGAQAEVNAIRAAMPGTIVSEEETIEIYNEAGISYRFVSVDSNSAPVGLMSWTESIVADAGVAPRIPILYPDRDPFIYNGSTGPVRVTVRGRAEGLAQYVSPPAAPSLLAAFQSGSTQTDFQRLDDERFVTTWVMNFVAPPATAVPKPRAPIVAFEP